MYASDHATRDTHTPVQVAVPSEIACDRSSQHHDSSRHDSIHSAPSGVSTFDMPSISQHGCAALPWPPGDAITMSMTAMDDDNRRPLSPVCEFAAGKSEAIASQREQPRKSWAWWLPQTVWHLPGHRAAIYIPSGCALHDPPHQICSPGHNASEESCNEGEATTSAAISSPAGSADVGVRVLDATSDDQVQHPHTHATCSMPMLSLHVCTALSQVLQ
jgi:hypothetical protein